MSSSNLSLIAIINPGTGLLLGTPSLAPNTSANINYVVSNIGAVASPATVDNIYLSPDATIDSGATLITTISLPPIAAGDDASGSYYYTLPGTLQQGTYYILSDVNQGDATGGFSSYSFTVTASPEPMLSGIAVISPSSSVGPGSTTTINYVISNDGSAVAGATTDNIYLSSGGTLDASATLLITISLPSLSPGADTSGSYAYTLPSGLAPGTYYIVSQVDPNNLDGESSTSSYSFTVTAVSEPDLSAIAIINPGTGLLLGTPTITSGTTANIDYVVSNLGSATAGPTTDNIYISRNQHFDSNATLIATISLPSIAAGGDASGTYAYTLPSGLTGGTYYVLSRVDPNNLDGATATSSYSFVVQAPVPPVITGTVAGQTITNGSTINPFSKVNITDPNSGQTETVIVTPSVAASGALSNLGGGSYNATSGVYTDTGSAAAVTAALDGLVFTPATSGQSVTTTFTITDTDTAGATATDSTTTVTTADDTVSETAPGSITATAGQTFAFKGANAVQVNDDALNSETFVAVLTDSLGNLSATGSGISGSSSHSLTIAGSLSSVNAALGTLAYNSSGGGSDTIVFATTDSDGSATSRTIAVSVQSLPTVSSVAFSSPGGADLNAGKTVTFTVPMSEAVSVNTSGGVPTLTLNDGEAASYVSGSGTDALTFSYTVQSGDVTADLQVTGLTVPSGSSITDAAGNTAGVTNATLDTGIHVLKVIQTNAGTTLASDGALYYLEDTTGAGPVLKYGGANVVPGASVWSPSGAVKTSTGYDVAWKNASTGQYTIWSTDNGGNYTGTVLGVVTANSTTLESLETFFQQDLNGDGHIGIPIQTDAGTTLASDGAFYYLEDTTGAGPALKYAGANVVPGASVWSPIGAVKTATGYDLAWKNASTGQYTIWSTDSSGNYTGTVVGVVSGTSTELESLETLFQQDLNGDGHLGIPIRADAGTTLASDGALYYLEDTTGAGPVLKYAGANVVPGASVWSPIGAVKTSTGYDVAWKNPATSQYTIWSTDSSGNYTGTVISVVVATDPALESLETLFQQDLNGDGHIGIPIQTDAGTTLASDGALYYLEDATGAGPALKYAGANVIPGASVWSPTGAVKTSTGYDVAWKNPSSSQYTIWSTDSSGNFNGTVLGVVTANSTTLESLETLFQQDLNGDGHIGIPIQTDAGTTLASDGALYYLEDSTGAGPTLKYAGANVVPGASVWSPTGAVKTSTGYDVAWKNPSTSQYTIWSTDSSGNYTGTVLGVVTANSTTLESLETLFQQDLNGDGHLGIPIQTDAGTTLASDGALYYLEDTTGAGPALKYAGANVVPGASVWSPTGAVKTSTGYDVAWKNPSTSQYTIWSTDSGGSYTGTVLGVVAGTSAALESAEATFQQDLNGDGFVGIPLGGQVALFAQAVSTFPADAMTSSPPPQLVPPNATTAALASPLT